MDKGLLAALADDASRFAALMDAAAAAAAFGPAAADCEARAVAARRVAAWAAGKPWCGAALDANDARAAARRAWPDGPPAAVAEALGL